MPSPGRARVPVQIEVAGDTHIGGRPHNEDAILLRPDLNLFIVADGAGGQNAGNVASSLAVTTIAHFFEQTETHASKLPLFDALGLFTAARRLSTAVQEANKEILTIAKSSDRHRGMGTTVVATLFDVERRWLHLAYVGDSRCYRLREGRLELLSFDHSLINDVLELRPNVDDARVKKLPQNVITRALGMSDNLRVSMRTHELMHDDRYLLCSDGMSDVITDDQIGEALAMDIGCDGQVELMMNMVLDKGADDNVACVVVDCSVPAGGGGKTVTRPLRKKASRPKMAAVRASDRPQPPSQEDVTEESVPEIVLYDNMPTDRDSSPLIHVVPAQSTTPEVVDAFKGVITPASEPPATLAAEADDEQERGTEPGPGPPPVPKRGGRKLEPQTKGLGPAPALRDIAPPKPKAGASPVDAATEKGGAAANRADDVRSTQPGHVRRPAGMYGRKVAPPPLPDEAIEDEPTVAADLDEEEEGAATREFRADGEAHLAGDDPDEADELAKTTTAAPRRHNPHSAADLGQPQTGDTKRPADSVVPGTLQGTARDSAAPARVVARGPRPNRALRATLPGGPPPPEVEKMASTPKITGADLGGSPDESAAFELKKELPPMRGPLDTSEFILEESVPCHACGSVISRTAEICMYCGATTGFLKRDD